MLIGSYTVINPSFVWPILAFSVFRLLLIRVRDYKKRIRGKPTSLYFFNPKTDFHLKNDPKLILLLAYHKSIRKCLRPRAWTGFSNINKDDLVSVHFSQQQDIKRPYVSKHMESNLKLKLIYRQMCILMILKNDNFGTCRYYLWHISRPRQDREKLRFYI